MIMEIVVLTSTMVRSLYTMLDMRPWQPGPVVLLADVLMRTPREERVNVQSRTVMFVRKAIRSFLQPGATTAPRPLPKRMRSTSV